MSEPRDVRTLPILDLPPAHQRRTPAAGGSRPGRAAGAARSNGLRHWLTHALRLAVVASLALALRAAADGQRRSVAEAATVAMPTMPPPATLRAWFGPDARPGTAADRADGADGADDATGAEGADRAEVTDEAVGAAGVGDTAGADGAAGAEGADRAAAARGWPVVDAQGHPLGWCLQTSPIADRITGYRGPSNLQIGVDAQGRIVGVALISSQETPEHVAAVRRDERFFASFVGRTRDSVAAPVDSVSGATLTSLAMADAIAHRLGAVAAGSSRFPRPILLSEARRLFPGAVSLRPAVGNPAVDGPVVRDPAVSDPAARAAGAAEAIVMGGDGRPLGRVIRTGPLADHIHGYQGPTELLVAVDGAWNVVGVVVRGSFDNQPYVSYLDDEPWFFDPFVGRPWHSAAVLDLDAAGVEGVSGATMTSLAAAETLVAAAAEHRRRERAPVDAAGGSAVVRASASDWGTAAMVLIALGLSATHLRGRGWTRRFWQLAVVGYFGLVTGNLLSIALLMGWARSGVPWWLAPGLTIVLAAALVVPAVTKAPFYCAQLCPHGAAQQWLRGRVPWQWHPRPAVARWLVRLPVAVLAAAYVVALAGLDWNLAAWEPFDAYLWTIGASASLVVAILSLLLAAVSPMAYCRFGCPTGQVLRYVRRHGRSAAWTVGDTLAVAWAVAAWAWIWFGG